MFVKRKLKIVNVKKHIKQIEKTLLEISEKLESSPEIRSFIIVGSYSKKISNYPNDVDCIVITNKSLSSSKKNQIHKQLNPDKIDSSDDTTRLYINSIEFGFAYRNSKKFYNQIKSLTLGREQNIRKNGVIWAIGDNLPEVMLSDLSQCRIIFDKDNSISNIKSDLLKQYPKALRVNLVNNLNCEIHNKLLLIDGYLKQGNNLLVKVGISDVIIAIYRLAHAKNAFYPLGLKHIQNYNYFETEKEFTRLIDDLIKTSKNDNLTETIYRLKEIYRKI